jgi:hypothetical protein
MILININRCPVIVCVYVMVGTLKKMDHIENLVVDGRIILRWIINK